MHSNKRSLASVSFIALVLLIQSLSITTLEAKANESNQVPSPLKKRTVSDAEQMEPEAMLTDLRDTRLSLNQLKQQAINLFGEATRSVFKLGDVPLERTPTFINVKMLDARKKYLAPRREWLLLYMNTLEPIVQLLIEDVNDVDTNGRKVSKKIEERINPLWSTWRNNVRSINESLDQVQSLIADAPDSNVAIAKAAINIFDRAEELEKVRYRTALILIEEYSKETKPKAASAKQESKKPRQ